MEVLPEIMIGATSTVKSRSENSLVLPIQILDHPETTGLADSGADANFINSRYIEENRITTKQLNNPINVNNVDGTRNKKGQITQWLDLEIWIDGRFQKHKFYVIGIGYHSRNAMV